MVELGVNIDHVATVRQARKTYEPDPVWAAAEAELGGADGITVHLREDRRHINDRDVALLRQTVQCKLNLEMSIVPQIVRIALQTRPDQATIVPERRQEITTEGGIDLLGNRRSIQSVVDKLRARNIFTSAFIDPDEKQIVAAGEMGFDAIELHTGEYANAKGRKVDQQIKRMQHAAAVAKQLKLRLHAGHGLNYRNIGAVAKLELMKEVNIGHAIISRAIFIGLRAAVIEMKDAIRRAIKEK